jgi:multidrug efflux pump subunit AcrB
VPRAIRNTPAMNTLMISVLVVGLLGLVKMRREVFPEFELEIILITVPYPGASPSEVEEGICQKLEEAVRSIDGIKKQTAVASEGLGSLVLEIESGVDVQRTVAEVRSEVDRIPSFPALAEDPEIKQITLRQPAIKVGVLGPEEESLDADLKLRSITEDVRDDLLRLPAVSQANIMGARDYEIDVEISESTLRRHGLTLQQVAQIIRRENLELPGGTIRTDSQDILIRGKNKGTIGREIENIPLITQPNGTVLTVADLGMVRDEFADITSFTRINGRPGLAVSVDRTSTEDLLAMTDAVHAYVKSKKLPPGYELVTWGDRSLEVRDRLNLLMENGAQGLALVLVILALFLNLRLAFWVALGIPVSILGACAILYFSGHTLNMLTSFTFVMAMGIVVDDAIVVAENIHTHRHMGKSAWQAAVDGTLEVLPSVAASVATTVIAFVPLLFVSGVMGKFVAVMPVAMIATLLVSLFESAFILPCHLAHDPHPETWLARSRALVVRCPAPWRWILVWPLVGVVAVVSKLAYPFQRLLHVLEWLQTPFGLGLEWLADRLYMPCLRFSLTNPAIVISIGVSTLLLTMGLVAGGAVPFVIMPKMDSNTIEASIVYPDGTPATVTEAATAGLERAIRQVAKRFEAEGKPVLVLTRRSVGHITKTEGPGMEHGTIGHHLGSVTAELIDSARRSIPSDVIIAEWRKAAGEYPGAEKLVFGGEMHGPGGKPIEFKLLARGELMPQLEAAVERTKARLRQYPGVFDIADDSNPGKWEFQLRVKKDAVAMGIPLAELAETVRAAYYGEEVMRLQRGRHEVKLMVRYPRDERRSLAGFDQIRVRALDGAERPLTELADVRVERGYAEINRVNQLRSITISADVDEAKANAFEVVQDLRQRFIPALLGEFPGVLVRWEGQQEQTTESMQSLLIGLGIALIAMFVLLTLEFTSYFQPLLIMAVIPFGIVGAIMGHWMLGMPLTLFSMFGLVTLTGIVVNDSIVLIDFINHAVRDGVPLYTALCSAGRRRLRPILLTSLTTIGGLMPLLFERSFQAQILIPMAVSICFGLMVSTVLCLILVPTFYLLHARLTMAIAPGDAETRGIDHDRHQPGASELVAAMN